MPICFSRREDHRVAFLDPTPPAERPPDAAGLNHVAFTFGAPTICSTIITNALSIGSRTTHSARKQAVLPASIRVHKI